MPYNYRLRLLEGLVRVNAWDKVDDILSRVYDSKLNLSCNRYLVEVMNDFLEWFLEPLYRPLSKNKQLQDNKLMNDFFDTSLGDKGVRQATTY
jgi:hypothetical protein